MILKLGMKHQAMELYKVCINHDPGSYGKNPSNIFFAGTAEPIATKIEMQQFRLEYNNVCINHDPVMTLIYFKAK